MTLSSLSEVQCILSEVPVPLKTFAVMLTLYSLYIYILLTQENRKEYKVLKWLNVK